MSPAISGTTRLAGVVGWPLDHTLSPAMHNAAYDVLDLDWVYLPLPVSDETALIRLMSAVKVLPFVGLSVTMPYKEQMLGLCDEVAALAEMAGAVNTVHVVDGRLISSFLHALSTVSLIVSMPGPLWNALINRSFSPPG